jgi:hypothetical protein
MLVMEDNDGQYNESERVTVRSSFKVIVSRAGNSGAVLFLTERKKWWRNKEGAKKKIKVKMILVAMGGGWNYCVCVGGVRIIRCASPNHRHRHWRSTQRGEHRFFLHDWKARKKSVICQHEWFWSAWWPTAKGINFDSNPAHSKTRKATLRH